jgi:NAD+ diphosphatase
VTLPTDADVVGLSIDETAVLEAGGPGETRVSAVAVGEDMVFPAPLEVISLRDVFGLLGDAGFLAAGRATQLVEWATTSRFCGRCGSTAEPVAGERCTRCSKCGLLAYPRIAPAIIVLVRRGDEAILARNARSKMSFYSTLAGFVEVGESLEQTVAREVREEVGVEVENVRYFGSQSWPFPHSLMVGFTAEWKAGEIQADGVEIVDAKWFRADALPLIPPPISISRRLIDAWTTDVLRATPAP